MNTKSPPSKEVLEKFGITEEAALLSGGQRTTFKAGNFILKPTASEEYVSWVANVFENIKQDGFRVAKYVKSSNGRYVVDGWICQEYLLGEHDHAKTRWQEIIELCKVFHSALAEFLEPNFSKSDFLGKGNDPWSMADKMAWGEIPREYYPQLKEPIEKLLSVLKPVNLPNQIIHGDFGGNVLFHPSLPPAVIDFSPYWRPAELASAVIIVNAISLENAPLSILDYVEDVKEINQMLVRAQLRMIFETDQHLKQNTKTLIEVVELKDVEKYLPTIDLIYNRIMN
jgi:uncharacterized protein (TIGR02569 family)